MPIFGMVIKMLYMLHLFHYYLLYVEWDREPQKEFYVPRMNVLNRK